MQDQFSYRITNDDGVFTTATVNIIIEPPVAAAIAVVPEIMPATSETTSSSEGVDDTEEPDELMVETFEEESEMEQEGDAPVLGESSLPEFVASAQVSVTDETGILGELGISTVDFQNDREQSVRTELLLAALDVVQHNSIQSSNEFETVSSGVQLQRIDVEFVVDDKRTGISNSNFLRALKRVDSDLQEAESESTLKIRVSNDAVFGLSISATAGVLAWALRGGALLASVMAATPIWSEIALLSRSAVSCKHSNRNSHTTRQSFQSPLHRQSLLHWRSLY